MAGRMGWPAPLKTAGFVGWISRACQIRMRGSWRSPGVVSRGELLTPCFWAAFQFFGGRAAEGATRMNGLKKVAAILLTALLAPRTAWPQAPSTTQSTPEAPAILLN